MTTLLLLLGERRGDEASGLGGSCGDDRCQECRAGCVESDVAEMWKRRRRRRRRGVDRRGYELRGLRSQRESSLRCLEDVDGLESAIAVVHAHASHVPSAGMAVKVDRRAIFFLHENVVIVVIIPVDIPNDKGALEAPLSSWLALSHRREVVVLGDESDGAVVGSAHDGCIWCGPGWTLRFFCGGRGQRMSSEESQEMPSVVVA